jgi:hypothetical protein
LNLDSIAEVAELVTNGINYKMTKDGSLDVPVKPELGNVAKSLLVDVLRAVMVVLGKNTDLRTINAAI